MFFTGNSTPVVLPDPIGSRVEEPPAGGGAPPPNVNDQLNISPEHQPADSWEEAAVDGDPLLTPENEEVSISLSKCFDTYYFSSKIFLYRIYTEYLQFNYKYLSNSVDFVLNF